MKKRDNILLQQLADMRPFVLQRIGEIDANLEEIRRLRQAGATDIDQAAFAAELLQEAGNVGYDEAGNLVRTIGGGKVEIIQAAD